MEVGQILGRGSEGSVLFIDETTVMKCCRQPNDGYQSSTFNEASVLAQYRHPNLIAPKGEVPFVLDAAGFSTFLPYYPRSLAGYKPTGYEEITRLAYDLLCALEFLHRHRVIHTDLKPNNILLNAEGRALVIDFGQSLRDYGQVKSVDVQVAFWRAPEIILGDRYFSSAIDLWALGIILYRLVCPQGPEINPGGGNWHIMWHYLRHLPYQTGNWPHDPRMTRTFNKIIQSPGASEIIRNVTELKLPETCPLDLQTLIRRCLDFDSRSRITAAQALALPLFTNFPPPPVGEVLPFPRGKPLGKAVWQRFETLIVGEGYTRKVQALAVELFARVNQLQPTDGVERVLACIYIAAQQLMPWDVSQSGIFKESYCPWVRLSQAVQEVARLVAFQFHPPLPSLDLVRDYHTEVISE